MPDYSSAQGELSGRLSEPSRAPGRRRGLRTAGAVVVLGVVAAAGWAGLHGWERSAPATPAAPPPPSVTVSTPLQRTVQASGRFLGQFAAVNSVELRAQVGGTLASIDFQDGQTVQAGDKLFTIDPRPYQIRLAQANAQLQTAQAKQVLTAAELWRAQQLKRTDFGSAENVDTRAADDRGAQAAIAAAQSGIADARLDLEFATLTAPFTGKMGARRVSLGSLISGSRGGAGQSTLLATIVSLDPIYLDFDMSEADLEAFQKAVRGNPLGADVAIDRFGDGQYDLHGKLDFLDNVVNRGSGTIRARAVLPNPDGSITPGQFARLRLSLGKPAPALLIPAAAVVPDQSRKIVMTVGADGTVVPKPVEIGDIQDGLQVIRSGLQPTDRVVIDGLVRVRPGAKVTAEPGEIKPAASAS